MLARQEFTNVVQMMPISFHPFLPKHLDEALAMSQAVLWPHRRPDWEMLLNLSDGVVAVANGAVVGTGLRTDFGETLSTLNMIIIAEALRGQGLGRQLMTTLMGPDRAYRLVATADGVPLYEKLGFTETGRIAQYQGIVRPQGVADQGIGLARQEDLDAIKALESAVFGAPRDALMSWLHKAADIHVLRTSTGPIAGFAGSRVFGRGHVIGPVCAPDLAAAKLLITHVAAGLVGEFLRIDVDAAHDLGPWLETLGLSNAGGGISMQRGDIDPPRARFALCSQALG